MSSTGYLEEQLQQVQALGVAGRHRDAEALLRVALQENPDSAPLNFALGRTLVSMGAAHAAAEAFRRALDLDPALADAAMWLGGIAMWSGQPDEAIAWLRHAVAHAPENAQAVLALGDALRETGSYSQAVQAYLRCIELDPGAKAAHSNLSTILLTGGKLDLAIEHARAALGIDPDFGAASAALADALLRSARSGDADLVYRDAVARGVFPGQFISNYLMSANYVPTLSEADIRERHGLFAQSCGVIERRFDGVRDAMQSRQLRIGYVSADLREHSVAYFLEPVLANHDRDQFAIYCYYNFPSEDTVSARLRAQADLWRGCHGLPDAALAERIRQDEVDILVDLSGHSAWNRLRALARKPAPVLATWLGYPTTTGLPSIDYRLSDWEVDPAGWEHCSTEAVVRLPASYYCFRPRADAPAVTAPPGCSSGRVTFGSFNNLGKVDAPVIDLWSRVLTIVPGARLLLKDRGLDDPGLRESLAQRFAARGVDPSRLELRGWQPDPVKHLGMYGEVDIGLDTWPYNGATTTCEALWMGVPVVTLRGGTHAGRMGASLLKAAGLGEWVVDSGEAYVEMAVGWAGRLEALSELRAGLRERMRSSALLDEAGFTRALEAAYRGMWERWCEGAGSRRELAPG